jgi:hypothetical protein
MEVSVRMHIIMASLYRLSVPLVLGVLLLGCSDNRETWTKMKGDYVLAVRTDPQPPQIGKNAVITAVLHYRGHPALAACPVKFRQYMPGMTMDSDKKYYTMEQAITSGIYRAESGVFSMGGDWVLEFEVKCEDKSVTMDFPFKVAWPKQQ